jgi:Cu/Ag efflux protein CusF
MKVLTQSLCAMAAFVVLAGPAAASDAVAAGKVKGVDAEKKEFVLTDRDGKDWTFKLGDTVVINRGGKESQSDLKMGDPVNVCYDKGLLAWTTHYILVQEGDTKDCTLVSGTVKTYDADKKQLTLTDNQKKDWTFPATTAKVRLNKQDSKMENVKIGDPVLAIVEKTDDSTMVKCLMINRK